MDGREAAGLRIIRNAKDCSDFCGFESTREGGGWLQNHKKCMGLSLLSWFWKWAGGGRLGPESKEMYRTAITFHVFGSGWEGGEWLQKHKRCIGQSTCSWFWKRAGRRRLASESQEMHRTVLIFMVLGKDLGGGQLAPES